MASLPVVNVTARIHDQEGAPVQGARIVMRLSTVERYAGLVVPAETTAVTDASGVAVLQVWPNALGTQGSEYVVSITHGTGCNTLCGNGAINRRFHVVVPNNDCNLLDIAELPPYEQKGPGQVIPDEVAFQASRAANAADRSQNILDAMLAAQGNVNDIRTLAESYKNAARMYADQAAESRNAARDAIETVNRNVLHFETGVVSRTEQAASSLTAEAGAAITRAKASALTAMEAASGSFIQEINTAGNTNLNGARAAIRNAEATALANINLAGKNALDALTEEAALFGEDFIALVERAESAAKKAACTAAAAANSATKACKCAERAEFALQNIRALILDAASSIVSREIIEEAIAKAQLGKMEMIMAYWGPLTAQLIRLADRHTADVSRLERSKIDMANDHQNMMEDFLHYKY